MFMTVYKYQNYLPVVLKLSFIITTKSMILHRLFKFQALNVIPKRASVLYIVNGGQCWASGGSTLIILFFISMIIIDDQSGTQCVTFRALICFLPSIRTTFPSYRTSKANKHSLFITMANTKLSLSQGQSGKSFSARNLPGSCKQTG